MSLSTRWSWTAAAAILYIPTSAAAAQSPSDGPHAVSAELHFASVVSGGNHSCGLTAEGQAYCWGRNTEGQLGDSTTTDRAEPVAVVGGLVFRLITAGGQHTCAVTTDDEPYCWGGNKDGQLGNGGRNNATYPFRVAGNLRVVQIAAGLSHTCGTEKHWDKMDRAVCWGSNKFGQLGTLASDDASLPSPTFGVIQYVSIAAGDLHTCGATTAGKFFCWGANERGQLGNGSITFSRVPFYGRMNRKATFIQVVTGALHTCGLTAEGEVFCWGENGAGQVGNGKGGRVLFPTLLKDARGFTALAAGGSTTCGVKADGGTSCWGSNEAGQYGTAASAGSRVPGPAVPGAWKALSLGSTHGCGVQPDGSASCWGRILRSEHAQTEDKPN